MGYPRRGMNDMDPVAELINRIDLFIAEEGTTAAGMLPPLISDKIRIVMGDPRRLSYPAALALLLAYGTVSPTPLDLTQAPRGARVAAVKLAESLQARFIPTVKDAFQNIGKNTKNLLRGNFVEFEGVLQWASTAPRGQLSAALDLAASALASMARPVFPMPELSQHKLTFARFMAIVDEMLAVPSEGAHEQFAFAATLEALVTQSDPALRVDTKRLNAPDQSTKRPGDVQLCMGGRLMEAYEITANNWATKLPGAEQAIRAFDLPRVTIVASGATPADAELARLAGSTVDISVLGLRETVAVMAAALDKAHRLHALRRLHELLDRNQPRVERTNSYVALLNRHDVRP